jgi:hypothetical protein
MIAVLAMPRELPAEGIEPIPPPVAIPETKKTGVTMLCVTCDAPFDIATHKLILGDLTSPAALEKNAHRSAPQSRTSGDDRLDRIGNAQLPRAAPGTVQRRLDPDLANRAVS